MIFFDVMSERSKRIFLETYDKEHATTMRVLRAYPEDKLDLKPSPKSNTARDLAWVFVLERGLGKKVWHDELAKGIPPGSAPPKPPGKWSDLLAAVEHAHTKSSAISSLRLRKKTSRRRSISSSHRRRWVP